MLKRLTLSLLIGLFCMLIVTDQTKTKPVITYVTGLWDVKRGNLQSMFKRSFQYYLNFFGQLLQTESNLIIFGDSELQTFVEEHRKKKNTIFILRQLDWFVNQWYTPLVGQTIEYWKRTNPEGFKMYVGFPQYGLRMYNPVVMSKLYLMKQALNYDIFNSQYFMWLDGGLTHVMDKQYIIPQDNAFQRLPLIYQAPFIFHTHNSNQLLYGFQNEGEKYLKGNSNNQFVWANFIGGRIETIETIQSVYQNILRITLQNRDMWTDESIFSLMLDRYPYITGSIYNITIQTFNYTSFSYFKYRQQEQIRYFDFAKLNNTILCTQTYEEKNLVILKQTRDDVALKNRMDQKYSKLITKHTLQQYEYHASYLKTELIKRIIIMTFFSVLYFIVKRKFYEYLPNQKNYN